MRYDRDLMIFKALCALSEYARASRDIPLKPTFGLRFALAFLYSQSNGDSDSFTAFWNEVQSEPAGHPDSAPYRRFTYANAHLNGIMRSLAGWECHGVPYQMIAEAQRTGNADNVFRVAREVKAKRVAEWEDIERAQKERAGYRR